MSGDGKRSVAAWPKLPRPSSTLPLPSCPLGTLASRQTVGNVPRRGVVLRTETIMLAEIHFLRLEALARSQEVSRPDRFVPYRATSPESRKPASCGDQSAEIAVGTR